MSEQLELLREHPAPTRKKRKGKPEVCKCGDLRSEHKDGKGKCLACAHRLALAAVEMGPLAKTVVKVCRCFKSRKREPKPVPEDLRAPAEAITLWRPTKDQSELAGTVHPKQMGWACFDAEDRVLTIYIANLRVKTPNEDGFGASWRIKRAIEGRERDLAKHAAERGCIDGVGMFTAKEAAPRSITLTRVSPKSMDSDNIASSFKHVIDGIKLAIGVDDSQFSLGGMDPRKVPLTCAQTLSGARGVFGVFIEVRL